MIGFTLKAVNSSGTQTMLIEPNIDNNDLDICIFGVLDGKEIQIDFDSLDAQSAKKMLEFLQWQVSKLDLSMT